MFHEILAKEILEVDSGHSRTWIRNFTVGGSTGVGTLSFAQISKLYTQYRLVDDKRPILTFVRLRYVRLTSDRPTQSGWVWSRLPLTATNWEVGGRSELQ